MKRKILFYIFILTTSFDVLTPSSQAYTSNGCTSACPFGIDLPNLLKCTDGNFVPSQLANNGGCNQDDKYDDASVKKAAKACVARGAYLDPGFIYMGPVGDCSLRGDLALATKNLVINYQKKHQEVKDTITYLEGLVVGFSSKVNQVSDSINAYTQRLTDYKAGAISLSPDDIKNISNSLVDMQNTLNQYQVDFEALKAKIPLNDPDEFVNIFIQEIQTQLTNVKAMLDQVQNQKNTLQYSLTSQDMNNYQQIVSTTQEAVDNLTKLDASPLSSQRNQLIADITTAAGSIQSLEDLGITKRFEDLTAEYQKELNVLNAAKNVLDKISDQTIAANPTLRNKKQSALQIAARIATVLTNMQTDLTTNIPDLMTKAQQQIMTNQSADASQKAKSANANASVILNQIIEQQANLAKNAPNDTIDPASLNGFIQNVNQIAGLIKEVQNINSLDSNSSNLLQQTVNTQRKFKDIITVSSIEAQQQSAANALKNGTAWQDVANGLGAIQKALDQASQTITNPGLQTRLQTDTATQATLKKTIMDQASPQFDSFISTLRTSMQAFVTAERRFHTSRNKAQGYQELQTVVPQIVKIYQEIAALSSKIGLPSTKGPTVIKIGIDYNNRIKGINQLAEKNSLGKFQTLSVESITNGQAATDDQTAQPNDPSPQAPAATS